MNFGLVYVIIVFNLLHTQQAVLPETYPNQALCKAALVQKQFSLGNWGDCRSIGIAPPSPAQKRALYKMQLRHLHQHLHQPLHSRG